MFERRPALRWAPLAAIGVAVAGSPILGSERGPVLCASRTMFDTACPFCGLTRGVAELARGDMAASWTMHPFAIVLLLEALVVAIVVIVAPPTVVDRLRNSVGAPLAVLTLVAMSALWLSRYTSGTLPPL